MFSEAILQWIILHSKARTPRLLVNFTGFLCRELCPSVSDGFPSTRNGYRFLWDELNGRIGAGQQSNRHERIELPIGLFLLQDDVLAIDRFEFAIVQGVKSEKLDFRMTLRDSIHGSFR